MMWTICVIETTGVKVSHQPVFTHFFEILIALHYVILNPKYFTYNILNQNAYELKKGATLTLTVL